MMVLEAHVHTYIHSYMTDNSDNPYLLIPLGVLFGL